MASDLIQERSDGRIKITVYDGDVLGDWTVLNELITEGSIEMMLEGSYPTLDERLNAEYLNYLFSDDEGAKEAFAEPGGWFNKVLEPILAGVNHKRLGVLNPGWVGVGMKPGKVPNPTDVDKWFEEAGKIKIRCEPAKLMEKVTEAIGFKVQVLPYSELYTALQTGVVEGWIGGGIDSTLIWDDILGHFIVTNDRIDTENFHMPLNLWNSLSKADQDMIQAAVIEAQDWGWQKNTEDFTGYAAEAAELGIEIVEPSPAIMEEIVRRDHEIEWTYAEELCGKDLMDTVRAAYAAAQ